MNLRQIEYMLMIVETRNISRAAERCYISQSGMSQQLAAVERELGVPLFQRINNELHLTKEGEIFIRYAREILGLHARALKELEDCSNPHKGRILIGVSPERGNAMMQQIYPIFQQSYPQVQFQIIENHLHEMEHMVCTNKLDICEAAYTPLVPGSISEDVKAVDLYTERILLVMPKTPYYKMKLEHLGAITDESIVDLLEFQNENFMIPTEIRIRLRSVVDWIFKQAGFVPRVSLTTSNNVSALNFVADGGYVSFVPQSYFYSVYAQTDRIYYRVLKQNPYWTRALIYRKEVKLTDAEKKFINIVKDFHKPLKEKLNFSNAFEPVR